MAGVLLGYLIVTFAFWIGHSGTTGSEYPGYSHPGIASLLALSGGLPLGAVLTPIVYHRRLRGTELNRWWLLLPVATLLGGMMGAFGGLGGAAAGGGFALWGCAAWIGSRAAARPHVPRLP
ncbi:hypothetical protein [Longimicrobium terrae]|uniref:Uncharacterized membrane protein YhaH (DUF805 family) n=1 Tax=Longimicrobium terrae TaxID=1639882 RepID=A0A841GYR6_9BACT|nr:hypothetical protein [Longimicrobium terrae]MBB4636583.1 uncharacterized membrane protein YhaH (DUF805 family) [Longimicrobium terrae]MBB6070893.1 uncharacterized membrane protein YhaH (DUF805 family) [Longimicrobium terrae]NNC28917.1 hypothetical protein [Longimicrobium terrae]